MKLFIKNKYTKIYFSIILKARRRGSIKEYTENHHIIPDSCGGSASKNNLVKLTAREHFLVHMILPKIMKNRRHRESMIYAANGFLSGFHKKSKGKYNSKIYENLKKEHIELQREKFLSENNPGKIKSPETIEKLRLSQLGKKASPETKKKMSESQKKKTTGFRKGSTHSSESKKKISENNGKPMLGKRHSEEARLKMSKKAKGRGKGKKLPLKTRLKMSESRKKVVWYKNVITDEYAKFKCPPSGDWKYIRPNNVPKHLKEAF
jgi:hypothetical protein